MRKLFQFKSIKTKILFGFVVIITLLVGMGVYNYASTKMANNDMEEIIDKQLPLLILDEKILNNMSVTVSLTREYMLYGDNSMKENIEEKLAEFNELEAEMLEISDLELLFTLFDQQEEFENSVREAI